MDLKHGCLAILLCLGLHCDRRATDPGAIAETRRAVSDAGATSDAGRVITSIHYGNQTAQGGVGLTCTHDGAATGSFMNAGFSPGGAEILPVNKTLTPSQIAEIWSAGDAVLQAMPNEHEAADASWKGYTTIEIHASGGGDSVFYWPSKGAHPDKRVQRLAALLEQVLSNP